MGEIKQNKQEVASRPTRQLSDKLGGQHPRNFHEACESHRSPTPVENHYLPPHRRNVGTSVNVNGECTTFVRTMAAQRLFPCTNPVTQPKTYNELLSFAGGTGGTIQPPLGVGTNKG